MTTEQLRDSIRGKWISIAPEIRPSIQKNADGTLKPFYLTRAFEYLPNDTFTLDIVNSADPFGKVPLVQIAIKGHIAWRGNHPIAPGAQKMDFMADEAYHVTPMVQGFADILNQIASKNFDPWEVNVTQNILRKAFAPFGLSDGQIFAEFDLIYLFRDMMFWGARNIDGRGFDNERNRPTNLQIPMIRA
jgi:Adenomatosis polyposis coli down-regulated 1